MPSNVSFAASRAVFLRDAALHSPRDYIRYFNDFVNLNDEDFAITSDGDGTIAASDGLGGWASLGIDSTPADNDETYVASASEAFKFDTTREALFSVRLKHTDGSTAGKSSFVAGLSDTVGANTITDAGALAASFDGAVFFKGEDDTNIELTTSNAATQASTTDLQAWVSGTTYTLEFLYIPGDGTTAKVIPIVDGVAGDPVDLTIDGLEEMHLLLGVKAHEAAAQTLLVDWVEVIQER